MQQKKSIPEISIIIPMYNVEKYLPQCLDSILAQTFQDYELIVIDDCSTDNSVKIVENYIPYFKDKLKLIKMKKNSGAADSRNMGIRLSRGRYITFIDSDDIVTKNALEVLYRAAEETKADVVHTEKFYLSADGELHDKTKLKVTSYERGTFVNKITIEKNDLEKRILNFANWRYFWFPWGKLFDRDFILKNNIEFPNLQTAEDTIFCFKCSSFLNVLSTPGEDTSKKYCSFI